MTVARKIEQIMTQSSWIRKMFEEGARRKAKYGADQVFDFSLGNPNLEPPEKFNEVLDKLVIGRDLEQVIMGSGAHF